VPLPSATNPRYYDREPVVPYGLNRTLRRTFGDQRSPSVTTWTDVARAEALVQRLTDVHQLVDVLTQDVLDAVGAIEPQRPHTLRSYVRTVFALVEGALSGMSSYLLEGQKLGGWSLINAEETRVFWDACPDPSIPRPGAGRATLTERTKLVFKVGHRVFGEHCTLDFGGVTFRMFRDAIEVRDRPMHPKRIADLDVKLLELAAVDKGRDWFRAGAKRFFEAAGTELKQRMEKGRRT